MTPTDKVRALINSAMYRAHMKDDVIAVDELGDVLAELDGKVLVPVGVLEVMHQDSRLCWGTYEYQCGFLDALKEAKSLLAPYVKGE